jgi:hypothetical protein
MSVYIVLDPAKRTGSALERAERFVFIRDRFTWSAFLFAPLWLLYRRLWLAFLGYAVLNVALQIGLRLAGVGRGGQVLVAVLVALLVGIEAPSLRRWTLTRRGWREAGIVVGDDLEDAERRFFDAWVAGEGERAAAAAPPPSSRPAAHHGDVVGLFPEPGANR